MKQFKIASLGEGSKSGYTASGERFFIPERFRTSIKIGDYALVVEKTFTQRTDADTQELVDCEPWTRQEVTMAGDLKNTTLALHEDKVNAGLADAIVAQEVKTMRKTFSLDDVALASLVA